MESVTYTLTAASRDRLSSTPNENKSDQNVEHIGASGDNRPSPGISFQGGGILIRPIPFYVRNNQPTLQEFEIF